MCIAIPAQVTAAPDDVGLFAEVDVLGTARIVNVALLGSELRAGDWILVHAGSAIGQVDAEEAQEILALLAEVAPEPVPH